VLELFDWLLLLSLPVLSARFIILALAEEFGVSVKRVERTRDPERVMRRGRKTDVLLASLFLVGAVRTSAAWFWGIAALVMLLLALGEHLTLLRLRLRGRSEPGPRITPQLEARGRRAIVVGLLAIDIAWVLSWLPLVTV